MSDQLVIMSELWPLSDEEAAQEIGAFLRELQIERRTGGTSQLQADEMLYLVREALWRPVKETGKKQELKEQLLEKYAQKEPNTFYQFDGWWTDEPEGGELMATETEELMSTCPDVRVLIPPGTDKEQASRLLKKIAAWIERGYAQEIKG